MRRLRGPGMLLVLLAAFACRPEAPPAAAPPAAPVVDATSEGGDAAIPELAWSLPLPRQGYTVRQGRALFAHYCATCHGDEGHGDGFNSYSLDPKPRDLAEPAFQAGHNDAELAAVIRSGGGVAGLSTGMPPWGRTLNERQIHHLVAYLRSLSTAEPEAED